MGRGGGEEGGDSGEEGRGGGRGGEGGGDERRGGKAKRAFEHSYHHGSSVGEEERQPGNEVTTAVVSFPGSSTRMEQWQ